MAVAASWKRITVWLEQHLPALRLTLNAPATLEAIAKVESETDFQLPEDVKESWLIHDGQRKLSHEEETGSLAVPQNTGLLYGNSLLPLVSEREVSALARWKQWSKVAGEDHRDLDKKCQSFPEDAIQLRYADREKHMPHFHKDSGVFPLDQSPPAGAR